MENNNATKEYSHTEELTRSVLQKIKEGEVQMKSKSFFVFQMIGIITLLILVLVTSVFLISYIIFSLKASGQFFLIGFGAKGFEIFLLTFPWRLLFLEILFLIVLDALVSRFAFVYKRPLVYIFFGSACLIIAGGFALSITPLHSFLLQRQHQRGLPVMGGFYNHVERPHREEGSFRGTVSDVKMHSFVLHPEQDSDEFIPPLTVYVPQNVDLSMYLKDSDIVFVAGRAEDGVIDAFGIKKLNN